MTPSLHRTVAVGITGGIGSGKSEVSRIFASLGARVVHTDDLARAIIDTHPAVQRRITGALGEGVFTPAGTLDRKKVARLIFQDETLKEKMNTIVHPYVIEKVDAEIALARQAGKDDILAVESALIYEARMEKSFDYIVVVHAEPDVCIRRIEMRDHLTLPEIQSRMNAQMPPDQKIKRADFLIHNSGDLETLRRTTTFIFTLLRQFSTLPPLEQ